MSAKLNVNIDHIATIREARKIREPDPVTGATLAELAGCHGITAHLREDRRHIQERDVRLLRGIVTTHLNLEVAPTPEMIQLTIDVQPDMVTLVSDDREEVTTEGGLNVAAHIDELSKAVAAFKNNDIAVSVFVNPDTDQVKAAKKIGADMVEFHSGHFANAFELGSAAEVDRELAAIQDMTILARKYGLRVRAGRGLNYRNVDYIAKIEGIEELTVGHSIIGRAVFTGMEKAVKEMLDLLR